MEFCDKIREEIGHGSRGFGSREGRTSDWTKLMIDEQASINGSLKRNLISWGLTDVSIYLKEYGFYFEWAVADALGEMLKAWPEEEETRLAVVAESLGSTIALNAVAQVIADGKIRDIPLKDYKSFSRRMHDLLCAEDRFAFFMFANQYGLIEAGRPQSDKAKEKLYPELIQPYPESLTLVDPPMQQRQTMTFQRAGEDFSRGLRRLDQHANVYLVAFHDPSDPLGYPLPSNSKAFRITNCYVNNSNYHYKLPNLPALRFVAGENFSDPYCNHGGYRTNPTVINVMLQGSKFPRP